MKIMIDQPEHLADLIRLNELWIKEYSSESTEPCVLDHLRSRAEMNLHADGHYAPNALPTPVAAHSDRRSAQQRAGLWTASRNHAKAPVMSTLDYDEVATHYDQRYALYTYPGTRACLLGWAESSRAGSGARFLELGCGTGRWSAELEAANYPLAGIEPSLDMLQRARERLSDAVELRQGHAESLPWPDASFDGVFCVNAFHHFTDKARTLSEAFRVLRPGGQWLSIGLDPHARPGRWYVYDYFPEAHALDLRRFDPWQVRSSQLQAAGFQNVRVAIAEQLRGAMSLAQAKQSGRLERSFTSQLTQISIAAYSAGLTRIQAAAEETKTRGEELQLTADIDLYATTAHKPSADSADY